MENKKTPTIGKHVIFTDKDGNKRDALATVIHNDECINLVSVNSGGTTEHASSVLQGEGAGRWGWPTVG